MCGDSVEYGRETIRRDGAEEVNWEGMRDALRETRVGRRFMVTENGRWV